MLVIPQLDAVHPLDTRLQQLATFMGISTQVVDLRKLAASEENVAGDACLAINVRVMEQWQGGRTEGIELHRFGFSRYLVYGVEPRPFDQALVKMLSDGVLTGVEAPRPGVPYLVAQDHRQITGPFAGLSFGPSNPTYDRVFLCAEGKAVQTAVKAGDQVLLARLHRDGCEGFFVGMGEVLDLSMAATGIPIRELFSRIMPLAMVLRHVAGERSWQPAEPCASLIIDDPLLRENYGFLHFPTLLEMARSNRFHATIAFIPRNYRRNASTIVQLVRENPEYLGICFHGNDHTRMEFATTDPALLNAMVRGAQHRMAAHRGQTGIECDNVMVFPQGEFSTQALAALGSHGFDAAVNTVSHPAQQAVRLSAAELMLPAVSRYGGAPLFLRRSIQQLRREDIAFNVFWGRPVLIGEHHQAFEDPEALLNLVGDINTIAPEIRWVPVGEALQCAVLSRPGAQGLREVRAFCSTVRISNKETAEQLQMVEWPRRESGQIQVLVSNGEQTLAAERTGEGVRAVFAMPGASVARVRFLPDAGTLKYARMSWEWQVKASVRRHLSELRDTLASSSPGLLDAAKAARRLLRHR